MLAECPDLDVNCTDFIGQNALQVHKRIFNTFIFSFLNFYLACDRKWALGSGGNAPCSAENQANRRRPDAFHFQGIRQDCRSHSFPRRFQSRRPSHYLPSWTAQAITWFRFLYLRRGRDKVLARHYTDNSSFAMPRIWDCAPAAYQRSENWTTT